MPSPALRLDVDTDAPDQTLGQGFTGSSMTQRHSRFLATGRNAINGNTSLFLHANIVARVMQGRTDVSHAYRLWRRARYWDVPGTDTAAFANLSPGKDLARDWFDDNQGKHNGMRDAPGIGIDVQAASGSGFAMLYEFVVFVEDHLTDIPGAYFFLVMAMTATTYEVVRSRPVTITLAQWGEIADTAQPWLVGRSIPTVTTKPLRRP